MNDYDHTPSDPAEPPEDAYVQSEISLLSPASPKPIHFPQPTNIPVLENMMDVGWNQTETHMNDPAMHNTELRPNAWRDPNDEQPNDRDSPFSTGGEAIQPTKNDDTETAEHSNQTASNGVLDEDASLSSLHNGNSHQANSHLQSDVAPPTEDAQSLSNPNVDSDAAPTADAIPSQPNEIENLTAVPTNAAPADGITVTTTLSPSQSQSQAPVTSTEDSSSASAPALSAAPAGLPPRPPPQEQPLMNQHYSHAQNLRDYHPHATQSHARNNSSGNTNFVSPSQSHNIPGNSYPDQRSPPTGAPSSVTSNTYQHSPSANTPIESRREYKLAVGETLTVDDQPWTPDTQRKYDYFLDEERRYVNEAKWDQFPAGSRLFVGNLSSEKVTKRDIFHVFHNYGELAQISIKQAYGFVQFLRSDDCARALSGEQGRQIRDKRIHLEVSKPQKAARNQQYNNNRRSRSPEQRGRNDRFQSNGGPPRRRADSREGDRNRYRSSEPRGGYYPQQDNRYRTRSRSPGYGRDSYSRASPRRDMDDDLPLPKRRPQDVPDVQLIAIDHLEKDFLAWVQNAFSSRGVRVDVLLISPRLREDAVVKRQIIEGVLAVSKLRRNNQDSSQIGLTIFKRRGGGADVQFEEYDHLDPHVAVELVLREKAASAAPAQPPSRGGYGGGYHGQNQYQQSPPPQQQQQQGYGYPPQNSFPPAGFPGAYAPQTGYAPQQPPPQPAGYGAPRLPQGGPPLPPNVNPNDLQNLLATLNPGSAPPMPSQGGGGYAPPTHQQGGYGGQGQPPPPQQGGYGGPGGQLGQPQGVDMSEFLQRLGTYGRQ